MELRNTVPQLEVTLSRDNWPRAVVIALALAALAFAIRWLLDPHLGNRQPFTPAFGAVALAVWLGSWRAGVLCACVCYAWANWFFIEPRYAFTLLDSRELAGASSYFLIAGIIVYLGEAAQRANERLREADRQKSDFLAVLSHELRNPLGPIVSATQILAAEKPASPQAQFAIGVLQRQTRQMTRLLDDLLDMTRITRNRLELRREAVDVRQCVQTATESVRALMREQGQTLEITWPQHELHLTGDAARVTQMIANLLHNAAKYAGRESIVHLDIRRHEHEAHIIVRDNGPGVPPERLPHLFEPFYTASDPEQPNQGLGVGLWLTRELAVMHGGSAEARPNPEGRGACFEIRLPLALQPVAQKN